MDSTGMPRPFLGESCTTSIKYFALFPPNQEKKKKKKMVTKNRHLSLRKIAAELSESQGLIRIILNDCFVDLAPR